MTLQRKQKERRNKGMVNYVSSRQLCFGNEKPVNLSNQNFEASTLQTIFLSVNGTRIVMYFLIEIDDIF